MYSQNESAESIAKKRIELIRTSLPNSNGGLGITQTEMAARLGIKQSTYSKIVSGSASIPTDILTNIAKIGHVSVDWLLGLTEDRAQIFTSLDMLGLTEKSGKVLSDLLSIEETQDESVGLYYLNEIISHDMFEAFLSSLMELENAYQTPHFTAHYSKEDILDAEFIANDYIKQRFPNLEIIVACDRKTIIDIRTKNAVDLATQIIEDVCRKDGWEQYCGRR